MSLLCPFSYGSQNSALSTIQTHSPLILSHLSKHHPTHLMSVTLDCSYPSSKSNPRASPISSTFKIYFQGHHSCPKSLPCMRATFSFSLFYSPPLRACLPHTNRMIFKSDSFKNINLISKPSNDSVLFVSIAIYISSKGIFVYGSFYTRLVFHLRNFHSTLTQLFNISWVPT